MSLTQHIFIYVLEREMIYHDVQYTIHVHVYNTSTNTTLNVLYLNTPPQTGE